MTEIIYERQRSFRVLWPGALTDEILRRLWQVNADADRWDWNWRFGPRVANILAEQYGKGKPIDKLYNQPVVIDNTLHDNTIYAGPVLASLSLVVVERVSR